MRHVFAGLAIMFFALTSPVAVGAQLPTTIPSTSTEAMSAIDPRSWRSEVDGTLTEVLTIGSEHLGQLDPAPASAMLEPLIERLIAFAPDIVTHEAFPGNSARP